MGILPPVPGRSGCDTGILAVAEVPCLVWATQLGAGTVFGALVLLVSRMGSAGVTKGTAAVPGVGMGCW